MSSLLLPFRFTLPFTHREISSVSTFSLFLVAALVTVALQIRREIHMRRMDPRPAEQMLQIALVTSVPGAKLGFVLELYREIWIEKSVTFSDAFFSTSGLVFYGSLLLALPSVFLYLRWKGLSLREYGDILAPALALGYGVGRLGCMVSGDGCFGYEAPWRIPLLTMIFGPGSLIPTHGVNVWNTPLLESAASFAFFFASRSRSLRDIFRRGTLLPLFLAVNGGVRFLVEFLRHNDALLPLLSPPLLPSGELLTYKQAVMEGMGAAYYFRHWHWYGLTQSQLVGAALVVAGLAWLWGEARKERSRRERGVPVAGLRDGELPAPPDESAPG